MREGYDYGSRRFSRLDSDIFQTRLFLRPALRHWRAEMRRRRLERELAARVAERRQQTTGEETPFEAICFHTDQEVDRLALSGGGRSSQLLALGGFTFAVNVLLLVPAIYILQMYDRTRNHRPDRSRPVMH